MTSAPTIFQSDDVADIGESVGLARFLPAREYHGAIAHALNEAFHPETISFFGEKLPTLKALGKNYRKIADAAERLLEALGYAEFTGDATEPVQAVSHEHGRLIVDCGTVFGDPFLSGPLCSGIKAGKQSAQSILTAASRLADLSDEAEPSPTREKDALVPYVFVELANIYFASFGTSPDLGSDRFDPSAPAALWAAKVFATVERRVGGMPPALVSIKSHTTFASRMRQGWIDWQAIPVEKQWPGNTWWPHVWNDPQSGPARLVPDWIVDRR